MKDLKLNTYIKALPADAFAALTNQRILEIWTGEPAEMKLEKGTEFAWYNGDISGKVIDFKENELLVQEWDFGDNAPSKVTIKFLAEKTGTRIEVLQTGIPDEDFADIKEGWLGSVFESLKDLLEE